MPPSPNFPVAGKNPELLVTAVNRNFLDRQNRTGSEVLRRFCFIDTGAISKSGVYPHSVVGYKDQAVGDTEPRDFDEAAALAYGPIVAVRRDGPAVRLPIDDDYDLYGLVSQGLERKITPWGLRLWIRLLAAVIAENPVGLDKVSFFNTAHPTNPLRGDLGQFSNDLSATPTEIDEDGWSAGFDQLMTVIDMGGTLLANEGMTRPVVIVPTKKMLIKAMRLFGVPGALIAQVVGAANAAAAVTSVTAGDADVLWIPELYRPGVPDTKKFWYICSDVGYWPFIIRETVPPRVRMSRPDGDTALTSNSKLLVADAKVGVGVASPHSILRLKTA